MGENQLEGGFKLTSPSVAQRIETAVQRRQKQIEEEGAKQAKKDVREDLKVNRTILDLLTKNIEQKFET